MNRENGLIIPVIAVVVLLVAGVGIYFARPFFISKPNEVSISPTPTTKVQSPQSENDIPPLYPGVEWGKPVKGTYFFTSENRNILELEGHRLTSTQIKSFPQEFINYYHQKLSTSNWEMVDSAGGPEGELFEYIKQNKHFTFGYTALSNSPGVDRKITGYQLYVEYN